MRAGESPAPLGERARCCKGVLPALLSDHSPALLLHTALPPLGLADSCCWRKGEATLMELAPERSAIEGRGISVDRWGDPSPAELVGGLACWKGLAVMASTAAAPAPVGTRGGPCGVVPPANSCPSGKLGVCPAGSPSSCGALVIEQSPALGLSRVRGVWCGRALGRSRRFRDCRLTGTHPVCMRLTLLMATRQPLLEARHLPRLWLFLLF